MGQQLHNRTNFESKWKWNINQQGFAKIQMTLRVQMTYFVNHIKYGQTVKFKDNSQFQWHLFLLIKFHLRFPFCAIKENCFQDFHLIIFKQKHKTDVTHQQKLNVKYHSHVSLLASGAAVVSKAKENAPSLFYRIEFYKEKKTPSLSMWEYFYNKSYLCSVTDMKLDWKTEVLMLNLIVWMNVSANHWHFEPALMAYRH